MLVLIQASQSKFLKEGTPDLWDGQPTSASSNWMIVLTFMYNKYQYNNILYER